MPAEFSRDEVARIAKLANLELDPGEVEMFARQLGDILAHANELQQIDTAGVAPTASVGDESLDRADEMRPSLDRTEALAIAPDPAIGPGLYKVPRVIG
ncbi:MAG TPA: Asp-tRNA(Asn)/Glu-tRNA(Gln) amidotransferase subunit GatC [Vicinamibacterales bacterium]|nr:Asp-tRNA(Asn)/Glu-tRNA(Gln) amidotransferase subunit GatC [Vicinamibacterales bacterium]